MTKAKITSVELNQLRKTNSSFFSSLQSAFLQGIITSSEVQEKTHMKKEEIIKKHTDNYSVWLAKDNYWKTRLPDGSPKGKMVKRRNEKDLEDAIVEFYSAQKQPETLEELYDRWLQYKAVETSPGNVKRLNSDYKRYLSDCPLIKMPITDIKTITIKEWMFNYLKDHELTKRQFNNMKTILNQLFDYALDYDIIQSNPSRSIHNISFKHFEPEHKKPLENQVYFPDELEKYLVECDRMYEKTKNMAYLATAMNFALGLRVGELVALEKDCFDDNFIYVKRQEKIKWKEDDDGWKRDGYEISEHLKTKESTRRVPLLSGAKKYLQLALKANTDSPFLFVNAKGERLTNDSIRSAQRYVNTHIGTPTKGNHAFRKTYASMLKASHKVEDTEIQRSMGHKDLKTTMGNYMYPTTREIEAVGKFEAALCPAIEQGTLGNPKLIDFSAHKKSRTPA